MGTKQALVPRAQNRGINSSSGLQNNTIKREEGLRRKKEERITTESLRKFCREENSEKLVNYFPLA